MANVERPPRGVAVLRLGIAVSCDSVKSAEIDPAVAESEDIVSRDKVPCAHCDSPTLPFLKSKDGTFLCMECWHKEKLTTDPMYALDSRLADLAHQAGGSIDGFTESERTYYVVRQLIDQELNGGFHQYFYNPSGSNYESALRALETLGEIEAREVLKQARERLFPGILVPDDVMERRSAIPFAFESAGASWTEVAREQDSCFVELSNALEKRLVQFAHKQGLVPSEKLSH